MSKYQNTWLIFLQVSAIDGFRFNDLIDYDGDIEYDGAWANVIVISESINDALTIVPIGFLELNMEVLFIDKAENLATPIEKEEINQELISEVEWLLSSDFVFKISDRLFPYVKKPGLFPT